MRKFVLRCGTLLARTACNHAGHEWIVTQSTTPTDPSPRVLAMLEASKGTSPAGEPVYLYLRCAHNQPEALIGWGDKIESDRVVVTSRFGQRTGQTSEWNVSGSSRLLTLHPGDGAEFIKTLLTSSTFTTSARPYGGSEITAVFDVGGLRAKLSELEPACGALP